MHTLMLAAEAAHGTGMDSLHIFIGMLLGASIMFGGLKAHGWHGPHKDD